MSQIQKGETFADGQIVTYDRLNDLVDSAVLLPPVINGQTALSPLTGNEEALIYDPASASLKKCLLKNALLTGNDISTGLISNAIGGVTIDGWTEVRLDAPNIKLENYATVGSSIDLITHSNIQLSSSNGDIGFSAPNGNITFTSTRSIRLPVGTTAQRPANPVAGETRFNSTTLSTETYNGSSWSSVYALYQVYEETMTPWAATNPQFYASVWTSAVFTKPSDELWIFETVSTHNGVQGNVYEFAFRYSSQTARSGQYISFNGLYDWGNTSVNTTNVITHRWVVPVGTAIASDTVTVDAFANGGTLQRLFHTTILNSNITNSFGGTIAASKFRIYKYKNA